MPKDYTVRGYRRSHHDDFVEDTEESKIKWERESYDRVSKRRNTVERLLMEDPIDEELADELLQAEALGEKVRKNAKTHRRRLRKLKEQGLF